MTIEKAGRLQNELRELFKKFGLVSGTAIVVHNDTLHFIEAHATEKNQWVIAINDALQQVLPHINPNIPIVNYNSAQDN